MTTYIRESKKLLASILVFTEMPSGVSKIEILIFYEFYQEHVLKHPEQCNEDVGSHLTSTEICFN